MQVISYKNTSPEADPVPMTWDEIRAHEGVYSLNGTKNRARFVVIRADMHIDMSVYVLYSNGSRLEIASPSWSGHTFYKTDEKVCFEIVP